MKKIYALLVALLIVPVVQAQQFQAAMMINQAIGKKATTEYNYDVATDTFETATSNLNSANQRLNAVANRMTQAHLQDVGYALASSGNWLAQAPAYLDAASAKIALANAALADAQGDYLFQNYASALTNATTACNKYGEGEQQTALGHGAASASHSGVNYALTIIASYE